MTLKRFFSFALILIGFLFCLCPAGNIRAQTRQSLPCVETGGHYEEKEYRVKKIRVKNPFEFIPSFKRQLDNSLKAALKSSPSVQQENENFVFARASNLQEAFRAELEKRQLTGRSGATAIWQHYRSCDSGERTLEIVLVPLTVAHPSYLLENFEEQDDESAEVETVGARGATTANEKASKQNKFTASPLIGYDRARKLFGGLGLSFESGKGIFNRLEAETAVSKTSADANAAVSGSREFEVGFLRHAEWRLGYKYYNAPADAARLKEGDLFAQMFAASRPLGESKLSLRFGASLEGGNRRSNFNQGDLPPANVGSSDYGAVKTYVGATLARGRHDWKVSYALQIGAARRNFSPDYVKQIFDTAYRGKFLLKENRPLQIESQFTAGSISRIGDGLVPVAERFFGGNHPRDFIENDSWQIRSSPFIRSFPENGLNRVDPAAAGGGGGIGIGGENFFSFNLTISQVIWGKPVVDRSIRNDPVVITGLSGQLMAARNGLIYISAPPRKELVVFQEKLKDYEQTLRGLEAELKRIAASNPPDAVRNEIKKFFQDEEDEERKPLPDAQETTATALKEKTRIIQAVKNLAVDDEADNCGDETGGELEEEIGNSASSLLRARIRSLQNALAETGGRPSEVLGRTKTTVCAFQKEVTPVYKRLLFYEPRQLEETVASLDAPAPSSGKTLLEHLEAVQNKLQPVSARSREELKSLLLLAGSQNVAAERRIKELTFLVERLDALGEFAEKAKGNVEAAKESMSDEAETKDASHAKNNIDLLAAGFGGAALPGSLSSVISEIKRLRKLLRAGGHAGIAGAVRVDAEALEEILKGVRAGRQKIRVPELEKEASRTTDFTGRVIDTFFRETNIIGVSPALMFDAARIGGGGSLAGNSSARTRYGLGGGVRLSVVTLDLTTGYSWNLRRQPGERRGAFVFSLTFNDLFR